MLRALRRREPPGPAPVLLDEFGNSIFTRKHRVEEEVGNEQRIAQFQYFAFFPFY